MPEAIDQSPVERIKFKPVKEYVDQITPFLALRQQVASKMVANHSEKTQKNFQDLLKEMNGKILDILDIPKQ